MRDNYDVDNVGYDPFIFTSIVSCVIKLILLVYYLCYLISVIANPL